MLECLQALAKCDEMFEDIHAVPNSYKPPYRITPDFDTIKDIVEAGCHREDFPPYKVIEKLGFRSSFVSGSRKQDEQWVISSTCGLYAATDGLLNNVVLKIPKTGTNRERLLQYDKAVCLMKAMIQIWDPDWASFQSHQFRLLLSESAKIPGEALVGWMTYVATRCGEAPEDLPVYERIQIDSQGTLLVATPEIVSATRPDQVAIARAVIAGQKKTKALGNK
jgi:hypothetical protein